VYVFLAIFIVMYAGYRYLKGISDFLQYKISKVGEEDAE
jgi:hypothetical protein